MFTHLQNRNQLKIVLCYVMCCYILSKKQKKISWWLKMICDNTWTGVHNGHNFCLVGLGLALTVWCISYNVCDIKIIIQVINYLVLGNCTGANFCVNILCPMFLLNDVLGLFTAVQLIQECIGTLSLRFCTTQNSRHLPSLFLQI